MHYQDGATMRDLSEFVILRGLDNEPLSELVKLPLTDQQRFQQERRLLFLDTRAELNHRYRYRVISRTSDGYESVPSNPVVTTRTPPLPSPDAEHFTLPKPANIPGPDSGTAGGESGPDADPVQ